FYIDEGGRQYLISHVYSIDDLVTTTTDRNGREINPSIFGVRFSVAQHESINIWGAAAAVPGTSTTVAADDFSGTSPTVTDAAGTTINPAAATLALLSSTDLNNLRDLHDASSASRQQATELPLQNVTVTSTGVPLGEAEWEFIAGPSPGLVPSVVQKSPDPIIPRTEALVIAPVVSEITGDVSLGGGAASESAIGTDVYLQIRRQFEVDSPAEIVINRVTDSSFISGRDEFEQFVAENPELQDGSGYEVWLVTETSGQRVERPIVKFEITGGRPGPATEELPNTFEPYELKELPFEQPVDDSSAQSGSENSDTSDSNATGSTGNRAQPDATGDTTTSSIENGNREYSTASLSADPDESTAFSDGGRDQLPKPTGFSDDRFTDSAHAGRMNTGGAEPVGRNGGSPVDAFGSVTPEADTGGDIGADGIADAAVMAPLTVFAAGELTRASRWRRQQSAVRFSRAARGVRRWLRHQHEEDSDGIRS
ncbi:MAG: hypothetical protein KDA89_10015, partial [Planctomycetaceae bacterium]|nr:hypothetical protein [Planctomycetaceae bacterium]